MIESAIPFVTDLIREYGPLVLFLVAFFENAAFLGWVVPGEKLLLAAGYFVQRGDLSLVAVWLCVFLGVLAGDHVGFFVGRYAGKPLIQRLPYGRAVTRVESLIHRYGAWVPLFGRFVAPIRPILLLTLGMMGLSYRRFVAVEVAGAAIWTSFWLGMGVLGGSAIEYVSGLGPAMLWLSIGAMVVFGVLAWRFRQQLEALVLGDSEAPGAQAPQPAA